MDTLTNSPHGEDNHRFLEWLEGLPPWGQRGTAPHPAPRRLRFLSRRKIRGSQHHNLGWRPSDGPTNPVASPTPRSSSVGRME